MKNRSEGTTQGSSDSILVPLGGGLIAVLVGFVLALVPEPLTSTLGLGMTMGGFASIGVGIRR